MNKYLYIIAMFFSLVCSAQAQDSSSIYEGPYAGALVGYNSYSLGDATVIGGSTSETIGGITLGGV